MWGGGEGKGGGKTKLEFRQILRTRPSWKAEKVKFYELFHHKIILHLYR